MQPRALFIVGDTMDLHMNTPQGPAPIRQDDIPLLIAEGTLDPAARMLSLDGGQTWLTLDELDAQLAGEHGRDPADELMEAGVPDTSFALTNPRRPMQRAGSVPIALGIDDQERLKSRNLLLLGLLLLAAVLSPTISKTQPEVRATETIGSVDIAFPGVDALLHSNSPLFPSHVSMVGPYRGRSFSGSQFLGLPGRLDAVCLLGGIVMMVVAFNPTSHRAVGFLALGLGAVVLLSQISTLSTVVPFIPDTPGRSLGQWSYAAALRSSLFWYVIGLQLAMACALAGEHMTHPAGRAVLCVSAAVALLMGIHLPIMTLGTMDVYWGDLLLLGVGTTPDFFLCVVSLKLAGLAGAIMMFTLLGSSSLRRSRFYRGLCIAVIIAGITLTTALTTFVDPGEGYVIWAILGTILTSASVTALMALAPVGIAHLIRASQPQSS
jgi:hypothetical protein